MEFYKILLDIMDEKGLNIPETARACGLPDGTIRSVIVRHSKSVSLEVAFKLSKGLGVSLERLNGKEEGDGSVMDPLLQEMCRSYYRLNQDGRQKLADYAGDLLASGRYQ